VPFALLDTFRTIDYGFNYNQFLASFTDSAADGHVNTSNVPFLRARSKATVNASLSPANLPTIMHQPMMVNSYPENVPPCEFELRMNSVPEYRLSHW